MTPEAKVKTAVKKILNEKGVYYFMPFGGGYGRAGIPDIVCCVNGRFLAVECKAGKGKPTALQEREMANIRAADGVAIVVTDDPQTLHALRAVIGEAYVISRLDNALRAA